MNNKLYESIAAKNLNTSISILFNETPSPVKNKQTKKWKNIHFMTKFWFVIPKIHGFHVFMFIINYIQIWFLLFNLKSPLKNKDGQIVHEVVS